MAATNSVERAGAYKTASRLSATEAGEMSHPDRSRRVRLVQTGFSDIHHCAFWGVGAEG
jgi:hypothetical protein